MPSTRTSASPSSLACRRALPLAPRALIAEFDLRSDLDSESDSEGEGGDEEGFFGEGGSLGSDYDSDDNSTTAQVHRFFAKVELEGLGIDLGEDRIYREMLFAPRYTRRHVQHRACRVCVTYTVYTLCAKLGIRISVCDRSCDV